MTPVNKPQFKIPGRFYFIAIKDCEALSIQQGCIYIKKPNEKKYRAVDYFGLFRYMPFGWGITRDQLEVLVKLGIIIKVKN